MSIIVAIASGDGLPFVISVESASPSEYPLEEDVLAGPLLDELPERLIGDKAYDLDALDERMREYGIEMISPNRSNRKRKWMQNCRRLVTRWEYHVANLLGFVQLGCLLMLLRHS